MAYQKVQFVYDGEEERYVSYDILSHEHTQVELILTDSEGPVCGCGRGRGSRRDGRGVPKEEYQQRLHLQVTAFVDEGPMNIFAGYSGLYLVMPESRFRELAGEEGGSLSDAAHPVPEGGGSPEDCGAHSDAGKRMDGDGRRLRLCK